MLIGDPRVPFRSPGEENASWVGSPIEMRKRRGRERETEPKMETKGINIFLEEEE